MTEAPETGTSPPTGQAINPDAGSTIDPDSTVGTGSVFAIGCTVLMMVILLIGIAIFISRQAN